MAKIVYVPACVFDQRMMARGLPEKADWPNGPISPILNEIYTCGFEPRALPCTETEFVGPDREPMSKTRYSELPGFTEHCQAAAERLAGTITDEEKQGNKVVGILGMSYSPACAFRVQYPPKKGGDPGIFMRILHEELRARHLDIPCRDINRRGINPTLDWIRRLRCD